jgi:archaellum component FlaC
MERSDWEKIIKDIKNDQTLCSLKIRDCTMDKEGPIQAACFVDDSGHANVIFRGTSNDIQWGDDGQAMYKSDSDCQKDALQYIKKLPYDNITVSGHSKGGNLAQYVTILSGTVGKNVGNCLSFDGQGFSDEFMTAYEKEIKENKNKILSISAENDFVNSLGNDIDCQRKYIKTDVMSDPTHYHCPNIVFDKNGNLKGSATKRGVLGQAAKDACGYLLNNNPGLAKEELANGLMDTMKSNKTLSDWLEMIAGGESLIGGVCLKISEYMCGMGLLDIIYNKLISPKIKQEINTTIDTFTAEVENDVQSAAASVASAGEKALKDAESYADKTAKEVEKDVQGAVASVASAGEKVLKNAESYAEKAEKEVEKEVQGAVASVASAGEKTLKNVGSAASMFINGVIKAGQPVKYFSHNGTQGTLTSPSPVADFGVQSEKIVDLANQINNLRNQCETAKKSINSHVNTTCTHVRRHYSEANVRAAANAVDSELDSINATIKTLENDLADMYYNLKKASKQYTESEAKIISSVKMN